MKLTLHWMVLFVMITSSKHLWATPESHSSRLSRSARVNGITLDKGRYQLVIHPDQTKAEIELHGKPLTSATIKIQKRPDHMVPGSTLIDQDGHLKELRLKKKLVQFLEQD